jgi:hypothetical protein
MREAPIAQDLLRALAAIRAEALPTSANILAHNEVANVTLLKKTMAAKNIQALAAAEVLMDALIMKIAALTTPAVDVAKKTLTEAIVVKAEIAIKIYIAADPAVMKAVGTRAEDVTIKTAITKAATKVVATAAIAKIAMWINTAVAADHKATSNLTALLAPTKIMARKAAAVAKHIKAVALAPMKTSTITASKVTADAAAIVVKVSKTKT